MVRIPAGATNIDIKQVSYSGKPEDDNYLGECVCVGPDRLRAEKYLLQPCEFSSRRSMPLSPNMTVKHPDWEGRGGGLLVGEARGFVGGLGPSRGQSVSIRERGSRRGGASLHLVAAEKEAQGFLLLFFGGVEGEF